MSDPFEDNARSGRKSKKNQSSLVQVFFDQWSDDWVETADRLCSMLALPDFTTRSGLKRVHANFQDVHKQLDTLFIAARNRKHAKIMGGVVTIYTKMCTLDAVLQNRIFQTGYYRHLVTLIEWPETRRVALRSLNALSSCAGKNMINEFSSNAIMVLKLACKHLDDPVTLSMVTGIFAHASLQMRRMSPTFDVRVLGEALLKALKGPAVTEWMFVHALICFTSSSFKMWEKCKDIPSFSTLMVACIHSEHYSTRLEVLATICQLGHPDPDGTSSTEDASEKTTAVMVYEPSKSPRDARRAQRACLRSSDIAASAKPDKLPPKLRKIANRYGMKRLNMTTVPYSRSLFAAMTAQYHLDNNIRAYGRAVSNLILNYEHAIPSFLCGCCGIPKPPCKDCKQPEPWRELLQKSMTALREQSVPTNEDLLAADILDWKTQDQDDPAKFPDFLTAARARHSQCPLFYYSPRALGPARISLLAAKKGLKLPNLPEWLRFALLQNCVIAAWNVAVLTPATPAEEGIVYLQCARTDAKIIIDEAPPDSVWRSRMLCTYMQTCLLLDGPLCDVTSPEFVHLIKEIRINRELLEFTFEDGGAHGFNHSDWGTLARIFLSLDVATMEWRDLLTRMDAEMWERKASVHGEGHDGYEMEDNDPLNQWLLKATEEPDVDVANLDEALSSASIGIAERMKPAPTVLNTQLALMKMGNCSWCGGPSAMLKKCAACGETRYCDSDCQKRHWPAHRAECRAAQKV